MHRTGLYNPCDWASALLRTLAFFLLAALVGNPAIIAAQSSAKGTPVPEHVRAKILASIERVQRLSDALERMKTDICAQSPQCKAALDDLAAEWAAYQKSVPSLVKEAGLPEGSQLFYFLGDPNPERRVLSMAPLTAAPAPTSVPMPAPAPKEPAK